MEAGIGIGELKQAAAEVLMELVRQGKVGAGDLIKLLGMEDGGDDAGFAGRDYVLTVRDE